MDHLKGKSMMHWNISEGNIDVITEQNDERELNKNAHLMTTVDFYKNKISSLKSNFNHVFDDKRKFDVVNDVESK